MNTQAIQINPVVSALEKAGEQFKARLSHKLDSEKFRFGVLTAVQKNPDLMSCSPQSVILAAYEAAELGVDLSPALQLGWLIPYGGKATFQPSYRAYIQKSYATKSVRAFYAEVVYEADQFELIAAPKRSLVHKLNPRAERKEETAIGAYAFVEFMDGHVDYEWLTRDQIQRRRNHSKAKNSMMWTEFWEEGWRKTPIRVLAKRLPQTYPGMEELAKLAYKDTLNDSAEEIEPGAIEREPDALLLASQSTFNGPDAQPATTLAETHGAGLDGDTREEVQSQIWPAKK